MTLPASSDFYKMVLDNLYDGIYFVHADRIITYWNRGAAKLTGYEEHEVLGKPCCNVFRHVDEQGNAVESATCPITLTVLDGRIRESEMYFHHKAGHLVPASLRVAPVKEANGQIVVAVEICNDSSPRFAVRQRLEELQRLALCDPLTGLANRRYSDMTISARLDEMERYGWPFGVLFIDIDRFKDINDTHGHDIGDKVLKMVSATLMNSVRSFDTLCRWGGEEFIAVIANVDETLLASIATRFCLLVEQSSFAHHDAVIGVTISIGATLARAGDKVESLLTRADGLMYESKSRGRNRVTIDSADSAIHPAPAL